MVKHYKFSRWRADQAADDNDEIENVVPFNPDDDADPPPPPHLPNFDSSRAPLHSIPEPTRNTKLHVAADSDVGSSRTRAKTSDAPLPLRTPEKQPNSAFSRNRFGWSTSKQPRTNHHSAAKPDLLLNHVAQPPHFGRNCGADVLVDSAPAVSRTTAAFGRPSSCCSDGSASVQRTPTKSITKPPNPGFLSRQAATGSVLAPRPSVHGALSRGLLATSGPMSGSYTTEVPHFDLKEDLSFWMDHNVQVIIRVRPPNSLERSIHGSNRCVRQGSAQRITWTGQPEARFTFDHVACESVDQETLFRMAGVPMVENCLSGYNSCMFAYGQTGSGKTHTMLGEIEDLQFKPSPNRGMTPRIFEFLFARIRAEEESRRDEKLMYSCKCSFLEIYNEQITDLLDPLSRNLLLREDVRKGVYVENLTELEVHTVTDILKLLTQGSSNRRVAATNMNRESSRSHSVFTCIIESRWERESTKNLRFARLNLVDLAGSERQKASGAEGDRLKEAANINKSLSTLGHVIMALVDVAHGKPRHVPYRDSRLTFLLQDSLGGNSKTMIIANISPSICCAAETLNTLKFAQRAKLIQNNAMVNEDSSANVTALQLQIRLLQEELFALKQHNISRSLSFSPAVLGDKTEEHGIICSKKEPDRDRLGCDGLPESVPHGAPGVTSKQLKSLESMLAGALRRERLAETSIKQLEAEIEQLNRLVHQREEDTRSTKMMLKFREEKIQRMETLLGDLKPVDAYLLDENTALSDEIFLLRAKVEQNPEVTRFALENIRILDKLRKFQDFYEEGERETLVAELSDFRDQVIHILDCNSDQINHLKMLRPPQDTTDNIEEKNSLKLELDSSLKELAECRHQLKSCLETNASLTREINDLHALLRSIEPVEHANHKRIEVIVGSTKEVSSFEGKKFCATETVEKGSRLQYLTKHAEDLVNLELELDLLKIILKEERSSRCKMEEVMSRLTRDLKLAEESALLIGKQYEVANDELKEAKSFIEALESEQLLLIGEMEDLRSENTRYTELLRLQNLDICVLKDRSCSKESNICPTLKISECEDSPLQSKLNKMKASLDTAKRLNLWYQNDHANQMSTMEEMDEVRRQVEAETAEVIVTLQEELSILELQVRNSEVKKKETENRLAVMEMQLRSLQDNLNEMKQDNEGLHEEIKRKDLEIRLLSEGWEILGNEVETALFEGHVALIDASDSVNAVSTSLPKERRQIFDQVGRIIRLASERDLLIGELKGCLEDAHKQRGDVELMLSSLKDASLVINESHQQECIEKDNEILRLRSVLNTKDSAIKELELRVKLYCYRLEKVSSCATAAFVMVNRLSEVNNNHMDSLKEMSLNQASLTEEAENEVLRLRTQLNANLSTIMDLQKRIDSGHDQMGRTAKCATVAFLVINRLSELNSLHLDALRHIDVQLQETMKMNHEKDRSIGHLAAGAKEAESRLQYFEEAEKEVSRLRTELNAKSLAITVLEKRAKFDCDRMKRMSSCATAAFLIVDRLAEVNSGNIDALRHIDVQLQETMEVNQLKDLSLAEKAAAVEKAEKHIEVLEKELKLSNDDCCSLRQQLAEQQKFIFLMQKRLEEQHENDIVRTKEKLLELKTGVFDMKLSMNKYIDQDILKDEAQISDPVTIFHGELADDEATFNKFDCNSLCCWQSDTSGCIDINTSVYAHEMGRPRSFKDNSGKEITIVLLQREIDSAIDSLKGVQAEVACLYAEKEKNRMSGEQTQENMEALKTHVLTLQTTLIDIEKQCGVEVQKLNRKLLKAEESVQEAVTCWHQRKKLHKLELNDAKVLIAQKVAEASSLLNRFEEAQYTMKEADIMINELMIANGKMKLEIVDLKSREVMLLADKECLAIENQRLQKSKEVKDQQYDLLEKQFGLDLSEKRCLVQEMEGFIPWMQQLASEEDAVSTVDHLCYVTSQFEDLTDLIRSWLEEIWCEIILKECTASVLQLCQIGALIDVVNELKGANRQLQSVCTNSDSLVSDLRQQITQSKEQLEVCTLVTDKFLLNVEKNFNRISRSEDETVMLNAKLIDFERKIMDLQLQEERMLERSDQMGSKLAVLIKELSESNICQQEIFKHAEELEYQGQNFMIDIYAKDVELLVLSSELQQMADVNADLENKQIAWHWGLENLKSEFVTRAIFQDLTDDFLLDQDAEVACLLQEVCETKMLLNKSQSVEEINVLLENELEELRKENCMLLRKLHEKESEIKLSTSSIGMLNVENRELKEKTHKLESEVVLLKEDMERKVEDLHKLKYSQSYTSEQLAKKHQDLQQYAVDLSVLQGENVYLKTELRCLTESKNGALRLATTNIMKSVSLIEVTSLRCHGIFSVLDEKVNKISEQMAQDTCESLEIFSKHMEELEALCCVVEDILSQKSSLSDELRRKDDSLKGLLFDLSLLQESAALARDQKNEVEGLMATLETKDEELAVSQHDLTEAVAHGQTLEAELEKNMERLSSLEMNLSEASRSLTSVTVENAELRSRIDQISAEKVLVENEILEKKKAVDSLEMELCAMEQNLNQMSALNGSLKTDLHKVSCERIELHEKLLVMEEKLQAALSLAEEKEALATEARQIAASTSLYAEQKEEEVQLLERSVQELNSTINVLENKVDLLKGEAERNRLLREELELELHSFKDQTQNVMNAESDIKSHLDERENNLQAALKYIQDLESDLANKNVEIAQCKAHISELNLHAEEQACEYKKKFKALEAMAEQVKPEGLSSLGGRNSSCSKLEKNATKARGSGSPFKCIGVGLSHLLKSETDEELSADRLRMEELEALAASRQKEIFMLNARLAAAESMTHDVIRDLLGVKLGRSSYLEEEVNKLKKQPNEFTDERKGWLEEMDRRRRTELIEAEIALEKLHQRDRLLTAENEMLKTETTKLKQREVELEVRVQKLAEQQNLEQRIHHHAKIKEENNQLKVRNDALTARVQRADAILSRVREELARYRARGGRAPCFVSDEERKTKEQGCRREPAVVGTCSARFGAELKGTE